MKKIKNNEHPEICSKCEHRCCEHMSCALSPDDVVEKYGFELSMDGIANLLRTGIFCVDSYVGDPEDESDSSDDLYYFIRVSQTNTDHVYDPTNGGRCSLLMGNGCLLHFDKRPLQAQALDPLKCDEEDDGFITKREIALMWKPYNHILSDYVNLLNAIMGIKESDNK